MNPDEPNKCNTSLSSKLKRVVRQHKSVNLKREDNDTSEEKKVKTKLLSMWNNVKYGWTVKLKTNFSKDSPVWLLGRCYQYKLTTEDKRFGASRFDCAEAEGIDDFKLDFLSRLWLTYRREFPLLNGSSFTTDCGWGCMLRSGQMLLAQALICHLLGREWRWHEDQALRSSQSFKEDCTHRKIIKWFGDTSSINSPFSIHALVSLGQLSGKNPGDWYGPGSVAHLLRKAVEQAVRDNEDLEQMCVYVAQDSAVYIQDVHDQCSDALRSSHDGRAFWKALILLVPLRLGMEKLNYAYGPCLTALLQLETCIGIIGGRPKHALYFVGFQDDKLIHLDPHYCQEVVDVWQPKFPLTSFHCSSPRKMNITRMDPSCCIGFYCRTQSDFIKFVESSQPLLVPPAESANCPIFVFSDGRSKDTLAVKCVIPDCSNELVDSDSCRSDDELGTDEFEFL